MERSTTMAELRRCSGSARFGMEPHEAPIEDFPVQPSRKDGLGRMCKVHWNEYTAGLARDAKVRNAAEAGEPSASNEVDPADEVEPRATRTKKQVLPTEVAG